MTDGPEPVEPSAAWRLSTNGWPDRLIAEMLHMTPGQVMKVCREDTARMKLVDPQFWADPTIDPRKQR